MDVSNDLRLHVKKLDNEKKEHVTSKFTLSINIPSPLVFNCFCDMLLEGITSHLNSKKSQKEKKLTGILYGYIEVN